MNWLNHELRVRHLFKDCRHGPSQGRVGEQYNLGADTSCGNVQGKRSCGCRSAIQHCNKTARAGEWARVENTLGTAPLGHCRRDGTASSARRGHNKQAAHIYIELVHGP